VTLFELMLTRLQTAHWNLMMGNMPFCWDNADKQLAAQNN